MTWKKIDDNQTEIVIGLRGIGACVQSLAAIGKGCPDLLVGYRGKIYLMEVKDGSKPPSKRKLTQDEEKWIDHWQRIAQVKVHVVESFDAARKVIGC